MIHEWTLFSNLLVFYASRFRNESERISDRSIFTCVMSKWTLILYPTFYDIECSIGNLTANLNPGQYIRIDIRHVITKIRMQSMIFFF